MSQRTTNGEPAAWALAVLAPLVVVAGLAGLHSVAAVLLAYQVGLGLVWPLVVAPRLAGLSRRANLHRLGLVGPGTARGVRIGLVLGLVFFAAPVLRWLLWPTWSPGAEQLRGVLAGWGLDPAAPGPVLAILAVVNGPAEELLWRGHLQDRLLPGRRRIWPRALALALLFTSYHILTIGALAPTTASTVGRLVTVLLGALFWTWSRRRWGSLWPALLSHTGVTLGYMLVCQRILAGG